MELPQHTMILEETSPSGVEKWYCPTCGRRMTICWDPWSKQVLEPGDMYAAHSAIKGGLRLESVSISQPADPPLHDESYMDDPYMTPWLRWMEKFESDDPGDKKT